MVRKLMFVVAVLLIVAQSSFAMPGGTPLNDDPFMSPGTSGLGCPLMLIFDCINGRSRTCYYDYPLIDGTGSITCVYRCELVLCQTT